MKKVLIFILLVVSGYLSKGQDPKLSHYWLDKIGANPALVGDGVTIDFNSIYRTQWTHLKSKFQTKSLTGDIYVPSVNGGFGVGINLQDNVEGDGNLRTLKIEPAISYWKVFGPFAEASVGGSFGIMQKRIENNFQFSDQIDPVLGFVYPTGLKLNEKSYTPFKSYARFGGLVRIFLGDYSKGRRYITQLSNYFMIGYSQSIYNQSYSFLNNEDYEIPSTQSLQASVNLNMTKYDESNWIIAQPYVIIHRIHNKYEKQSNFYSTTVGNRFMIKQLQCYAGYRFKNFNQTYKQDAIVFGLSIASRVGENRMGQPITMNFYYSSDFTINGINASETGSTHEVGLIFKLPTPFQVDPHLNNQGHRKFKAKCATYL